ncbi:hypothetical protein TWF730_011101 [Orbilia blumenaviensis]|uniref:FHA domain-containing protein n=1 Tax=Orbilia blumenaviensis TaxID=1796055 RepID=A0AAV9UJF2_9PEZI
MATPPFTSPSILTRGQIRQLRQQQQQQPAIPSSPPPPVPFLSRRRTLKRTASACSSIDPDSPSDRPSKRRALRSLRRTNSVSGSELAANDGSRMTPFPCTPPRILKRTPSLLPAIDFQASPPRQAPRLAEPGQVSDEESFVVAEEKFNNNNRYPTPVPTSDIGFPTSPAREAAAPVLGRQGLNRTSSAFSELRAPLVSVPTVMLPKNCQPVTFGRSANKCTYLLSKSHIVSRVHFQVTYLNLALRKRVEIHCVGYNGGRAHCRGEIWELRYGDIFWSESGDDIMLETDNTRVVIRRPADDPVLLSPSPATVMSVVIPSDNFPYPPEFDPSAEIEARDGLPHPTEGVDSFGKFFNEPVRKLGIPKPRNGSIDANALAEPAPLRMSREPWNSNPDSPCPQPKRQRIRPVSPLPFTYLPASQSNFTLYEDSDDDDLPIPPSSPVKAEEEDHGLVLRESEKPEALNTEVEVDDDDDEEEDRSNDEEGSGSEYDEEDAENVVESTTHAHITPTKTKNSAKSRKAAYKLKHKLDESVAQDPLTPKSKISLMKHLSNQLAFSRLSSTPLSNLVKSLPPDIRTKVPIDLIQALLTSTPCVGEIKREGKDASGRPLEPEYYYIADMDFDMDRKSIVSSLNKPSLRSCRKTHKQYFWKKPRV